MSLTINGLRDQRFDFKFFGPTCLCLGKVAAILVASLVWSTSWSIRESAVRRQIRQEQSSSAGEANPQLANFYYAIDAPPIYYEICRCQKRHCGSSFVEKAKMLRISNSVKAFILPRIERNNRCSNLNFSLDPFGINDGKSRCEAKRSFIAVSPSDSGPLLLSSIWKL